MRFLDRRHLHAVPVKHRSAQDQDRRVDEERHVEGHRHIDQIVLAGGRPAAVVRADPPRLHQSRVEEEIVGHHRRAEDANRHEQGAGRQARPQTRNHPHHVGLSLKDLDQETAANGGHKQEDHGLHLPHTPALQVQKRERVEGRDQTAPEHGQTEQELQGDDGSQNLRQVACRDGHLGKDPEHQVEPGRILRPAGLGQVVTRHNPQPRGQRLEEDRHQVGHQEDPDQRIAEPGAPLQVRRPVARVHVAHAHQVRRPKKGEQPAQLLPPSSGKRNINGAVDLLQRSSFSPRLLHHRHAEPRSSRDSRPAHLQAFPDTP